MSDDGTAQLDELLTALLQSRGSRVLSVREMHERLEPVRADLTRESIEDAVARMERRGAIVPVRGKRYSLIEFTPYQAGVIRIHTDGHGTLRNRDGKADIRIDRKQLRGAMNGDTVLARVDRDGPVKIRGREYFEAEIIRILERAHRTVVGKFYDADPPFVRPFDERIDVDVDIDPQETMGAVDGEMVDVEIQSYPGRQALASGRVIERLGMLGDPGVDIEVVLRKHHIPSTFPDEVLDQAESIPLEVPASEIARRVDLRDRTIVTIDGETAKDFDDAVEVHRLPDGAYRLGVHIADVSHYVTEGSLLDLEAAERGTSVYFPGRAIPMLPERLSNGICSLNPRVDRLTFSVEIVIDARGRFVDRRTFKSVIRTVERMTYTDVNAMLTEPSPELAQRYASLADEFRKMHELYTILRKRREARGSIDFDLPEADVLLGEEGEIEAILPTERNVAHRLIEEFMLAANEVVAQQLIFSSQPGVYRVHHQPDAQKLEDLRLILKEFKIPLRGDMEEVRPGELQRVLKLVVDTPQERFLTEVILRSMKRAFYAEESLGHFALALEHYCHFTSPIRRYPDLLVHRRLTELLSDGVMMGDRREKIEARHVHLARQSSDRERRAEGAEREVLEWKKVIFMRERVGERHAGRIVGVVPFGLFVELDEIFVQGLVPVSSIGGDYWAHAEREHRLRGADSGVEFRLGDAVVVEVHEVNEERRQIEFRLVEANGTAVAAREESSRKR